MEMRSLEITVTSAKGLKKVTKTDVFVTAKLSGDPKYSDHHREQRTQVAKDNGSSPKWSNDDVMRFTIDQNLAQANRLVITFKIKKSEQCDIGEVHVPVKELLDHLGNDKTGQRYVTYRIKKANGKPRGDLSFTYSFTDGTTCSRYPVNKPVRPPTPTHLAHEPMHSNGPVLSQLLPSVGSFSYNDHIQSHQSAIYPPMAHEPEIFPPAVCFPGLFYPPPHGYPTENPPALLYTSVFPGLSYTPPEGYPPMSPYRF